MDSKKAKLMNIRETDNDDEVETTLFVAEKEEEWFSKKVAMYASEDTEKGNPKHNALVASVNNVVATHISDFFTLSDDRRKYEALTNDAVETYELWVIKSPDEFDGHSLLDRLSAVGISHSGRFFVFDNVAVTLVSSTKRDLKKILAIIDNLSELRIFRSASVLVDCASIEGEEWTNLIQREIVEEDNLQRVAILDSGVNNSHTLLQKYLPDDRLHNATSSVSIRDNRNHGSLLAGLILYGDLTDAIQSAAPLRVNSDLTSVKIITDEEDVDRDADAQLRDRMYAVIAEDAIIQARGDDSNIMCSAVTTSETNNGEPSAWSSALDKTLFNDGNPNEVLFVSAGNVEETMGQTYPNFNILTALKDPAQSWNAISVGAYTNKVAISSESPYADTKPIAPRGGLSPYSPSSLTWGNKLIKPEIVMEGGNAILDVDRLSSAPTDLNLVSTSHNQKVRPFDCICATSAATALAAKLASKIKASYPAMSPLSIRALMIHSAEWTDEMIRQNTEGKSLNMKSLIHTCGYGVPNERKAIASGKTYATFFSEQELRPFERASSGRNKIGHMHIYDLPWSEETLLEMGEEMVTLKVTLSFYVDPAPGSKTRNSMYKYPSLSLRFDVNASGENREQFMQRVSKIEQEGVAKSDNDSKRWTVGIKMRDHGSIISDSFRTTAAEIASCKYLSVYPCSGWWNNLMYKEERSIRYSLIVSLETTESDICSSIGIAQQVAVEV